MKWCGSGPWGECSFCPRSLPDTCRSNRTPGWSTGRYSDMGSADSNQYRAKAERGVLRREGGRERRVKWWGESDIQTFLEAYKTEKPTASSLLAVPGNSTVKCSGERKQVRGVFQRGLLFSLKAQWMLGVCGIRKTFWNSYAVKNKGFWMGFWLGCMVPRKQMSWCTTFEWTVH